MHMNLYQGFLKGSSASIIHTSSAIIFDRTEKCSSMFHIKEESIDFSRKATGCNGPVGPVYTSAFYIGLLHFTVWFETFLK